MMAEETPAPSIRLYDKKSGLAKDFTPEDAHDAFASGAYGVRKGQQIHVALADGTVGSVAGARGLTETLQQGGSFATPGQFRQAELEAKHGGIAGGLKAAGLGVARGLTVGLSDVGLRALAPTVADEAAELKEVHPYISTGAEVVGAVAPALFSGGGTAGASAARGAAGVARAAEVGAAGVRAAEVASGAGRLARTARGTLNTIGAPANLVAHAGEGIEAVVRSALGGAGKSFVARAGTRAGALAARGLVEGGIYGAGGEISEAALGNHELNGEKLLSAIGHGALFGAATGGALGVVGEVGSTGLRKLSPWLDKAANLRAVAAFEPSQKIMEKLERMGVEDVGRTIRKYGLLHAGEKVGGALERTGQALDAVNEKIADIVGTSPSGVRVSELLRAIDEPIAMLRGRAGHEHIVHSLEQMRDSMMRKWRLLDEAGGALREGFIAPSEVFGIGIKGGDLAAPKAVKAVKITSHREPFAIDANAGLEDAGAAGWRVDSKGVARLHPGEVESPFVIDKTRRGHIGDGPIIRPDLVEGADIAGDVLGIRRGHKVALKSAVEPKSGATHHPITIAADEAVNAERLKTARHAYDAARTVPISEVVAQRKALDAIAYKEAKALDPSLRVEFLRQMRGGIEKLETEAIHGASVPGEMAAKYKDLKTDASHLIELKNSAEKAAARRLKNNSFSILDVIAGAGGIASGHGLAGLALGAGSKAVRERGSTTTAVLLDKLANLGAVQRALAEVDTRIASGVEGALKGRALGPRKVKLHSVSGDTGRTEEYEERITHVRNAIAEPHRAQDILQPMLRDTPATGQGLALAAERASIFLASKIPQTHQPGDSLTPQLEKPRVTSEQMAQFLRYARAADDPLTVLDDMEHGRLTSEGVEAMQAVAPKLYEEVRTKLSEGLASRDSKIPAEKEIQLRLFFNLRTGMLAPDYVAMFQSPGPKAPQGGGPTGNSQGALSTNLATDAQHAQSAPLGSK